MDAMILKPARLAGVNANDMSWLPSRSLRCFADQYRVKYSRCSNRSHRPGWVPLARSARTRLPPTASSRQPIDERVANCLRKNALVLERLQRFHQIRPEVEDGGSPQYGLVFKRAWIDTPTHSVESGSTCEHDKARDLPSSPIRFSM